MCSSGLLYIWFVVALVALKTLLSRYMMQRPVRLGVGWEDLTLRVGVQRGYAVDVHLLSVLLLCVHSPTQDMVGHEQRTNAYHMYKVTMHSPRHISNIY